MARLMWICGILLFAAGVALGVLFFVSPQRPAGIDLQSVVTLIVGGILALGLGSVIETLKGGIAVSRSEAPAVAAPAEEPAPAAAPIPEFGPRGARPAAEAVAEAAPAVEEVSRPTRDTITALEQARQKIEQALDPRKPAREEAPAAGEENAEEAVAEEEVVDDGQLYVVEERVIRRHPARILSDGTVEAETSEGWMRFENLEHLDEYLDSIEPARG